MLGSSHLDLEISSAPKFALNALSGLTQLEQLFKKDDANDSIDRIQIGRETISTSAKNTREENYHPRNIMTHQSHDLDPENEEIKSVMRLEQSEVYV